jgi:putative flippase GtrA
MKIKTLSTEFLKYFLASLIALLVDLLIFLFGTHILQLSWLYASFLSFFIGVIVSYSLSITMVFKNRRFKDDIYKEFLIFFIIGLPSLFIGQCILWLCIDTLNFPFSTSKIVASIFSFLSNFALRKMTLFKEKLPTDEAHI